MAIDALTPRVAISSDTAKPARTERLYRRTLSPADQVAVAYVAGVAILIIVFAGRLKLFWLLLPAHAATILLIILLAKRPRASLSPDAFAGEGRLVHRPRTLFFLVRFWYPLLLIPFTYKELTYLIPRVHSHDLDHQLALIDKYIFGLDPVIWLTRIDSPPLTLALQLSYLCYYVFPVSLAIVLWRQRRFREMHYLVYIVLLGFYLSYFGYISVPAIGPRFFLDGATLKPLNGPLVQSIRATLDRLEGMTRDCFPSGHTELTLLVLFCAWRLHRRTFWTILIPAMMLIFSTVYLRYHYAIDVISGACLALIVALVADRLFISLGGRFPPPEECSP